ncbi:MAG: bifunctional diguanylate cyclase/phosphodiesterase [Lachnospiraceae bacterium]|nr:bifunctional diguanylate cyclase/phosphodiesterase [Lachnospiraceae bacterium]
MKLYENKTKNRTVAMIVCFVFAIFCGALSMLVESHPDAVFGIGSMVLPSTSFLGLIQALKSSMCIMMVCFEYKMGRKLAFIFMTGSMIFMIIGMIRKGEMSALPGMYNTVLTAVSILIISNQLEKSDKRAVTDYLTGLRNRRGLTYLIESKVREKKLFHVVYFEIDNFRTINDNLGHKYGDIALTSVADHLKELEDEESVFVSRIGGAEFAAVVSGNIEPKTFAEKVMDKIGSSITETEDGFNISIALSVYAGISSFPENAENVDDLLKFADIAVFNARQGKDSKVAFFNQGMRDRFERQIELEKMVKESLIKDYFYLVYQPQYEIKEKKLRGFETLIRLKLPDGPTVSPVEFIPVVEASELIMKIDSYVMRRAMKEAKKMVELCNKNIVVSINVSAKNISSPGFVDEVRNTLEATQFPPECLEIEITEYSFAKSKEITIANVKELRTMGIQIALDDFGTGYTSLSQVMHLPISLLKIDKSLVDDIENNQVNRDFVDAIIYMGHLMNCEVISEGVESMEQLGLLKDHECDFVQGYVWGKPMEYDKALELCKKAS